MKSKAVLLIMMFVAAGSLLSAQGLKVEPGTSIKVETGTTLDLTGGDLLLKSDNTGDASLIDLGSVSHSGGGTTNVERYLTQGQWHLIASPNASSYSSMFNSDYLQFYTEATNAYSDILSLSYSLNPMQGYSLWTVDPSPTTEVFVGTTNTGAQSFSFTKTSGQDGWNMIGNPYPSKLDWEAVTIPAGLNGAVWLYDPTIGENGDYLYYLKGASSGNTTSQYIPSGQGFFVQATASGTLSIDNNVRGHAAQTFYKNTTSNSMLVLKATGNNITTQTAIRFNANASAQVDRLYDITKIIGYSPDVPILYSKADGTNMALNTLPSIYGNESIPVYFEAGTSGDYTILATEIESIDPLIPIYLEDVSQNYFQDLRANPEYSFTHTTGATKNLIVHFANLVDIDQIMNTAPVQCYAANGILHVNFSELGVSNSELKAQIEVFSLTGSKIMHKQTSEFRNVIPVKLSQSIYLVKVSYQGKQVIQKVINQ